MNTRDDRFETIDYSIDTTQTRLTGLLEQTSIYSGRFSEQRALTKLCAASKEGSSRSAKISCQDLKAMVDDQRLERVFNKEVERRTTKHESFKKDLFKARSQKKGAALIKRAKRALGAISVPAVFAMAAITLVAGFMSQIESQVYAAEAKQLIAEGNNEKAYESLRKSLLWNPYNATASFEAGRIDERRKDRDEAYKHYERAVAADPDNVELLDRKGSAAIKLNRFNEAAQTYTHLLKISKNARKKLHHYGNRAVAFSKLGEYEKAIDDYTSVIKMKRKDQDALLGRAFCQCQINEFDAAIADLDRLLDLNPNNYEALLLKGWAHQTQGQFENGQADFEAAIAAQPQTEKGYVYLAHMFRAAGNNEAAVAELDKVIAINPSSREAHVVKGQILLTLGQHKAAVNEFKTVDGLKKEENYFSLLDRARASFGAGHYREAVSAYSKLIALRPELCELYYERAQAAAAIGEHQKAVKDFDQAIKLYPHYTQAMLARADSNIKLGNEVSAVADFQNAIKSSPSDARPLVEFGKFNLAKQQFVTAKESFDKAMRLDGENAKADARRLSEIASNSLHKLVGKQPAITDANALSKTEIAAIENADFNGLLDQGYKAIKAGKTSFAQAALGKAVRLDPNSKIARRYLVSLLLNSNQPYEAEAQVAVLNQMGAGESTDSLKLANSYRKAGNCQKAIAHFEQHLSTNPTDVNALVSLSDAHAALGNIDKAADVCTVAMNKTTDGSNYARLKERVLSLKESQSRVLEQKQGAASNNSAPVDTQG